MPSRKNTQTELPRQGSIPELLVSSAKLLISRVDDMSFGSPVTHVYNPLRYAWDVHRQYLERYAAGSKRVIFVGMNPGPWGMAQTGIPFGEVGAVRDWLQLNGVVDGPEHSHPKRPVQGFQCPRSEVSGRRIWSLLRDRFATANAFFSDQFIMNYCPLVFMEDSGRNRTPDKLPAAERDPLLSACDEHLRDVISILTPRWLIGVGKFAERRLVEATASPVPFGERDDIDERGDRRTPRVASIPHPSPANPAANRNWAGTVTRRLVELGVWQP